MVGRRSTSPLSLKTSNLLLPLIKSLQYKSFPSKKISSIVHAPTPSTSSKEVPQHLLGNEDFAWERFSTAVTDVDVGACYNMFLKDFEHSGIHDLFKVSYFILFFLFYIYIYISHP